MSQIPCFVISLPDCTERRTAISRRLQGLGIAFEFFDAVDGRHGLDPVHEAQIDRVKTVRDGHTLSDPAYACALSHINVYRRIVAAAIPHALILEDDALPQPALPAFLEGQHYRDAEVTQLYIGSYPYVRRRGQKRILSGHTSHVLAPIMRGGTVGYVISGTAAHYILETALPVTRGADWPECAQDILERRQWRTVHPLLVTHPPRRVQEAGQSVIIAHSAPSPEQTASQRRGIRMQRVRDLPRKILYKRLPRNHPRIP